ncbi:hydrolase [Kitasatospora xanthocidica]|uniref:alpha/beta fold hydrolase n=1 Tax=Kitasatospora xanthocidica TaxID=83382 RepID=UPI0016791758|nr:alpha/beta fold hydrolase [Kitasatospora xanthocidica]GHF37904.1 hydrolase [Kitasatospora xanthocidica]
MAALETEVVNVPGARLHVEVRGSGPLLLLVPGGASDAAVFEALAEQLAARYRVVSYDPRGISRSPLDGPPVDQQVEVQAEDALRLLDLHAVPGEPVRVLGSCAGALVALELLRRHPDRVDVVVAHEPPTMRLLPDADAQLAFFEEVHQAYLRDGAPAGMRRLASAFGGRPVPDLPEVRDNTTFFLAHVMRPTTAFLPDLAALARLASRITPAGGEESRGYLIHRPVAALAAALRRDLVLFPGGHSGYAKHPEAFARQLSALLEVLPDREAAGPTVTEADGPVASGADGPTVTEAGGPTVAEAAPCDS